MKKPLQKISEGIKRQGTKGVFKAAAERAGESTHEFAEEHKHDSGLTGERARLALVYEKHRPKKSGGKKEYSKHFSYLKDEE